MTDAGSLARWPGRVAVGILRGEVPAAFVAESEVVLGRVLASQVVARTASTQIDDARALERIRTALLEERWGDAVLEWMSATGEVIDAYPDETVWTDARLDLDRASMEIRLAPIFDEQ